jgi:hypothetical protein
MAEAYPELQSVAKKLLLKKAQKKAALASGTSS